MENMIRYNANICVNFYGQIAKKKRIEAYVKNVIRYFCPNIRRVINVDIYVKNKLDCPETYAYCYGNRKHIEIELKRMSHDFMMLNLAHELVHAKQYLTGQLSPTLQKWKSEDYSHVAYSRTPWEREAYRKEDWIWKNFWLEVDNDPHFLV